MMQEDRLEKYNKIMDLLKNEDPAVLSEMLSFVKFIIMDKFSAQFAKYRNVIGHLLDNDYQNVGTNKWLYGFKTLQLTGQICVLNLLGFSYQEICKTFFVDHVDATTKLKIMIQTNIGC